MDQFSIILLFYSHSIYRKCSAKNYMIYILRRAKSKKMLKSNKIVLLKHNHIMEYEWGSSDPSCLINQLRQQPHKRYAELWMGTHPKAQSQLTDHTTLGDYLKSQGSQSLPFLFKILCIQKALSIQLHPNKKQAEYLHADYPQNYADDNQKPQMFVTLSEFECLFGIINADDLDKLFTIAPFKHLKTSSDKKIKNIITELLSIPIELRKIYIDEAISNIENVFPERKQLLLRLQQQFPYDEGILVSCLLRYKVLPPGQCFAIAAGVPHAYLKGSCFEIMKNSDNVVRLGLTPKLKDVKTMLQIMNDTIGLDGYKVNKSQQGYLWNNLFINPIQIQEEEKDITISNESIGIVYHGVFNCIFEQFKAGKGEIFYIKPGNYKVRGPFLAYLGGYSYQ